MKNVHQFGLLLNELQDTLDEKELKTLTDQWENEYREYLFDKVRSFKKIASTYFSNSFS